MRSVNCSSCDANLSAAELAEGWCESCGKKIPAFVIDAGRAASRGDRDEAGPAVAPAPVQRADAPGPKVSGRTKVVLVLLAVFAANAGLAWALAGTEVWRTVMLVAGLLVAFPLLGGLFGACRRAAGAEALAWLFVTAYVGALLGSGYLITGYAARATVHIDNFSAHDVTLELDGTPWRTSPKGGSARATLRRGTYTLVVRSRDGQELDRRQITVEGRGAYVLNVLGAQVYTRGRVDYSNISLFGSPPGEERVQSPWFKADVDHLFETPPKSITVTTRRGQGVASGSRSYLLRGEPKARPAAP